jgi:hypothetical protein
LREEAYVSIRQHTSAYVSIRQHTLSVKERTACVASATEAKVEGDREKVGRPPPPPPSVKRDEEEE